MIRRFARIAWIAVATLGVAAVVPACRRMALGTSQPATFTNPIVTSRAAADPWVVREGATYYFTATIEPEGGLWVWSAPTLTGIDAGRKVKVWTAPPNGPTSRQIWAPELHRLGGQWYLYFTASDGVDDHHRLYVMAATGSDPLGAYGPPERVDMRFERYAIDPSILALPDGRLYLLFAAGGLWAAPMSDPQHVSGDAVRIAEGTEPWEHGWRFADGRWAPDVGYWIEAPEPLLHEGRTFIVYSAGHTATRGYFLGLLELRGNDPLAPNAWVKRRDPLFASYDGADGGAYSPGHNGFTTSPDGREDWLVYHARDRRADGTTPGDFGLRTTRAQRFGWRADGTPDFGHPVPSGVPLPRPSGERQVAP